MCACASLLDPQATCNADARFESLLRTVAHLVKKFPDFLEPEGSLPCSERPATCPYTKPDSSRTHLPTVFPQDPC